MFRCIISHLTDRSDFYKYLVEGATYDSRSPYLESTIIETHMVTIMSNVAKAGIPTLTLMLSTCPFGFELQNDSSMKLCLFRKEVSARHLLEYMSNNNVSPATLAAYLCAISKLVFTILKNIRCDNRLKGVNMRLNAELESTHTQLRTRKPSISSVSNSTPP